MTKTAPIVPESRNLLKKQPLAIIVKGCFFVYFMVAMDNDLITKDSLICYQEGKGWNVLAIEQIRVRIFPPFFCSKLIVDSSDYTEILV